MDEAEFRSHLKRGIHSPAMGLLGSYPNCPQPGFHQVECRSRYLHSGARAFSVPAPELVQGAAAWVPSSQGAQASLEI